jgi:hypothetical protein
MPVSGAASGTTKVGAIRPPIRSETFRNVPGKQALLISLNMDFPLSFTNSEEDEVRLSRVIGERARRQFREAISQRAGETAYVMCGCAIRTPLRSAFRCLYCEEYFCNGCAEIHLGERRAACAKIRELGMANGTAIYAALEIAALFA